MRNNLKTLVAASLLAATAAAPAFSQATGGILTLDLDRIYAESAAGKSAQAQLQARYQGPSQQAQSAAAAAQSAYVSQLQAAQKLVGPSGDASKLPPATRAALGAAQDKLEEARGQFAQVQQAVQQSAGFVREQINQQVLPIAEQVRAEKKAAVVLVKGALLAVDPTADITAIVLPRLDAKITTVPIVPPQPAAPAAAPATAPKPGTQGR
jgi:Skp family chaperone for outer membrane proteins